MVSATLSLQGLRAYLRSQVTLCVILDPPGNPAAKRKCRQAKTPAKICKHSMSERCIEECAPKGEMENLEVRGELTIDRMPGYEIREDLPWKARFRLQEAYTKKAVDFIQGRKEVPHGSVPVFPRRRPSSNSQRYQGALKSEPGGSVPFDETNGTLEVRPEHPSETIGIPEVAGKAEEKSV